MESRKSRRNLEYSENKKTKKSKWKLPCIISIAVMIFVYYQVYILFNYTMGKPVTEKQISLYKWMVNKMHSSEEIQKEGKLEIAILGNIKVKKELLESYETDGIVDYSSIFSNISFEEYDYTIANLNTSIVQDTKPNGMFYGNTKLLKELNNIGVDILITATKELSAEKDKLVSETCQSIVSHGIQYVGSNIDEDSYYIIDKDNIKIGVLAYVSENYCKNSKTNVYSSKKLKEDIAKLKKENVDGIIVFVDTLRNNQEKVREDKKELLNEILKENVDLIISSDTNNQLLYQKDGNSKYIKFSLGDVIGLQEKDGEDTSKVIKVSINKKQVNGKNSIEFKVDDNKTLVALSNADKTKYKIVDLDREIENFDKSSPRITVAEYNYLLELKENID